MNRKTIVEMWRLGRLVVRMAKHPELASASTLETDDRVEYLAHGVQGKVERTGLNQPDGKIMGAWVAWDPTKAARRAKMPTTATWYPQMALRKVSA